MSYIGDRIAARSGSVTKVTGSLSPSNVLPASNARFGLKFYNNSDQTVYIAYMSGSNAASWPNPSDRFTHRIQSASFYEEPRTYFGPISVVWGSIPATGSLFITEIF